MAKILIIDDEKDIIEVFKIALTQGGFEVEIAGDARDGLTSAKEQNFDLFILDQMLPDLSGNEILRILKNDEKTKNIPVTMLSNFGHDDLIKGALNEGAIDYILKYQITPDDLVEKVRDILSR